MMIKKTLIVAVAPAAVLVALAACGSGGSHAAARASPALPPLYCSSPTSDNGMTFAQVLGWLVADQESQDVSLEQGWVEVTSGSQTSQGNDLAAAAQSLSNYSGTQLAADASHFVIQAQTFLSDQSSGLMPGWTSEYQQIAADIHKLADQCGLSFPRPARAPRR
jgi:hypothetical protein